MGLLDPPDEATLVQFWYEGRGIVRPADDMLAMLASLPSAPPHNMRHCIFTRIDSKSKVEARKPCELCVKRDAAFFGCYVHMEKLVSDLKLDRVCPRAEWYMFGRFVLACVALRAYRSIRDPDADADLTSTERHVVQYYRDHLWFWDLFAPGCDWAPSDVDESEDASYSVSRDSSSLPLKVGDMDVLVDGVTYDEVMWLHDDAFVRYGVTMEPGLTLNMTLRECVDDFMLHDAGDEDVPSRRCLPIRTKRARDFSLSAPDVFTLVDPVRAFDTMRTVPNDDHAVPPRQSKSAKKGFDHMDACGSSTPIDIVRLMTSGDTPDSVRKWYKETFIDGRTTPTARVLNME
jgi:hypothetical protein